jgi:putative transposase
LGLDIGSSEAETFWSEFLRKPARCGLRGVKLVISDAREGLKAAAAKVLGATWQRCRVHFLRNALTHAKKNGRRVVCAFIATAFAQETPAAARKQSRHSADQLRQPAKARRPLRQSPGRRPPLHGLPQGALDQDLLDQPNRAAQRRIKRGTNVIGIFSNDDAIIRLVGAILMEQNDEWTVQRARYMTLETIAPISDNPIVILSAVAG